MKRVGFIVLLVAVFLGYGVWVTLVTMDGEITPEQLQEKVLACAPRWANYNEDLKGQIGSTPVARWKGEPVRASIEGGQATVVFSIEGYWVDTAVQLPVLAREPLGDVMRATRSHGNGSEVSYFFALKPEVISGSGSVWLEIQYPHHIKRIVFDSAGFWSK